MQARLAHRQHAGCDAQESDEAQAGLSAEASSEAPGDEGAAEDEQPDVEAPLLVAGEGVDSNEKQALPALPVDRSLLGLGLYALSGCFLSTMLVLTKKLSALPVPGLVWSATPRASWQSRPRDTPALAPADQLSIPVFEVLLARSVFLLFFALIGCAVHRKNPFGYRCA